MVTMLCMELASSSLDELLVVVGAVVPFADCASVEVVAALPLLCRSLYFSIASASRSRMRLAMGDKAEAAAAFSCAVMGGGTAEYDCTGTGEGEGTVNLLVLLEEPADGCPGE